MYQGRGKPPERIKYLYARRVGPSVGELRSKADGPMPISFDDSVWTYRLTCTSWTERWRVGPAGVQVGRGAAPGRLGQVWVALRGDGMAMERGDGMGFRWFLRGGR